MPPKQKTPDRPASPSTADPVDPPAANAAGGQASEGDGARPFGGAEDAQILKILNSIPQHSPAGSRTGDPRSPEFPSYRSGFGAPVSDSPRGPASTSRARAAGASPGSYNPKSPPTGANYNSISTGYQSPGTIALAASSASTWPGVPPGGAGPVPSGSGSTGSSPVFRRRTSRSAAAAAASSVPVDPQIRGHSGSPDISTNNNGRAGPDDDFSPGEGEGEGELEGEDEEYGEGTTENDSPARPSRPPRGGAKKGQPKPRLDKSTDAWKQTRKENHKEVERRRRETINDGITELKKIVPGSEKNKGEILKQAVQYIRHLKDAEASNIEKWTLEKLLTDQAVNEQTDQLDRAVRRADRLERENDRLKALVKKLGGDEAQLAALAEAAEDEGEGDDGARENGFADAPSSTLGKRPGEASAAGGAGKRPRMSA